MIPWYAWMGVTVLLVLASLVNDRNIVCLIGAGACAATGAAMAASVHLPIEFQSLLFSWAVLTCLVFVNGPPSWAESLSEEERQRH